MSNIHDLRDEIYEMIGDGERIPLENVLSAYRNNPSARPLLATILQRKMLNVVVDGTQSPPIAYVYPPTTGEDE